MRYIVVFCTGAAGYSLLEVLWRGYTHWTMTVTGGFCLLLIYSISNSLVSWSLWEKCLLGSAVITATELVVGITVNIILKWNVWDYSQVPFNFMGQICLPYSVLWFFLCFPVMRLCMSMGSLFEI